MKKTLIASLSCFLVLCLFGVASGQALFDKGLNDYKNENYEEALTSLIEARKLEPASTVIAFYLGLTYKKMEDYESAVPYLRDAVTLTPPIKEAIVELIDVLYQTNKLDEAQKWVAVAEKEGVNPGRIQFLKGLNLAKQGRNDEAISAFESAKQADKTLVQAADFQIANAYLKAGKLKESQKRFKSLITLDPSTDLATYARDYERAVTDKLYEERPFRFSVGIGYKYDSNVNVRPSSGTVMDDPNYSSTVSGQEDTGITANIRAIYIAPFSFRTPYSFSAQYSLYLDRYMRRDDYNMAQQSIGITPGYSFKRVAFTLPLTFGYVNLQRDIGSDFLNKLSWWHETKYLLTGSIAPTARFMVNDRNFLELAYGFTKNQYYYTSDYSLPKDPNENRDGESNSGALGWTYLFKEGEGLFALKYMYTDMGASGRNWSYRENRFSLSFIYPLQKNLKLQYSSDAAFTNYKYVNTIFDTTRRDETYTNSIGIIYTVMKNTDIIGRYAYIKDNCNISTYDYNRSIAAIGIEYRF